jgi:phage gp46-like protein
MKQLFLFVITLFICGIVFAQKNFEGSVTYRLHSTSGEKQDAELKVLFGNKKLKLFFKEKETYENDALVVLLDSAVIYSVNVVDKTFKRSMLTLSSPEQKPQKKLINGYSTTQYHPENTGVGSLLGGMLGSSSVIFYVADSLYYYIPTAFIGNKELLMVQKGKIVLGAEIQIDNPYNDPADSASKSTNIITAEAVDIKPMALDEQEFFIPADFVDRKDVISTDPVDSTVAVADTVAVAAPPPPAKKPVKKKPSKPAPRKSTSTPKAVIRKE